MYQKRVLDNNLILFYEIVPEDIVFLSVGFHIGALDDIKKGTAHFCEHMLYQSSSNRTSDQANEELELLGTKHNARTSYDCTIFDAVCQLKDIDRVADIVFDRLLHPLFDLKEIEQERGVILQELQEDEDDISGKAQILKQSALFNGTSFDTNILGSKKSIKSIKQKDLQEFWSKNYVANNCVIFIRGNLQLSEIEDKFTKYFVQFRNDGRPNKIRSFYEPLNKIKQYIEEEKTDLQNISVVYAPIDGRDVYKSLCVSMLDSMLSDGLSSVLMKELRKLGLVYGIYAETFSFGNCKFNSINLFTTVEHKKIIAKLKQLLEDFVENGITDQQVQKVFNSLEVELLLDKNDLNSRNSSAINSYIMCEQPYDERREEMLEALKQINTVTLKEIAREIFKDESWVCVGPKLK